MNTAEQSPEAVAHSYLAVWNEPYLVSRLAALKEGWAVNASYADPLMQGTTPEEIASMIEAARSHFPNHSFVLRGKPDGHHRAIRFSWDLVTEDGIRVAGGTDIVKLNSDGKFAEVIGFLD
ncbi:polyketide cyclase (plasmid) [Neorhizobium sp. SOG26]|uniref:Nuclear transport factor 2 family protein n=1 Tax=Neorhizobium turbinariae TaxID=2937795 RepID=A0ABT0IXA5_9HYPH|nr:MULTISPECIES: nuclear transport factor 2 family protein [Neorhizobium]AXV17745.1 polyketide cyclase [Neorhizobium sp. SOG26]MCK8782524.1 nuclear transport factor 2 family protein [Neorhizobium turbinariae]